MSWSAAYSCFIYAEGKKTVGNLLWVYVLQAEPEKLKTTANHFSYGQLIDL